MKFVLKREKHQAPSGFLAELVSSKYADEPFKIHSYLVKINKGYTRANHYHKKKKEWITSIGGKTLLKLKHVKTGQRKQYLLDFEAKDQKIIFMPPFWSHSIAAIGGASAVLVFTLRPEDKEDTISHEV
ncbi:MAG: WxcM-like domain-containing protein [Candidatus Wildermuthbacteria bacterium]|nr:WxcM-like domain-containing protein [Candidatus Wildermuthbacteria bacterium]